MRFLEGAYFWVRNRLTGVRCYAEGCGRLLLLHTPPLPGHAPRDHADRSRLAGLQRHRPPQHPGAGRPCVAGLLARWGRCSDDVGRGVSPPTF
jgi:hypothetical protein